jgi:hypothetical protein
MAKKLTTSTPGIALTPPEAAAAIGVGPTSVAATREHQIPQLETREAMSREAAVQTRAELRQLPSVEHGVRVEVAVNGHLFSECECSTFAAALVRPPDYIVKGAASDSRKREARDNGLEVPAAPAAGKPADVGAGEGARAGDGKRGVGL